MILRDVVRADWNASTTQGSGENRDRNGGGLAKIEHFLGHCTKDSVESQSHSSQSNE